VLALRRDQRLAPAVLPEARVRSVESGLSRRQWLEFASTFFSASTVSFLMGAVHLWTGFVVQAVLTVAAVIGLVFYHRRPRVEKRLLQLGMPDHLAKKWEASFPAGFALLLATVPEDEFDEAQGAFLEDDALLAPSSGSTTTVSSPAGSGSTGTRAPGPSNRPSTLSPTTISVGSF
jgi:hypothetical protein